MKVKIVETLERVITVNSIEEAKRLYKNCEVILEAVDFTGVDFIEVEETE